MWQRVCSRFETSWTSWTSWWGKFLTPTTPLRTKNRHCSRKQTSFCMIYWKGLPSMETPILLRCNLPFKFIFDFFFFNFLWSSFVVESQPSMPQGKGALVLRTNVQFSVKTRSALNYRAVLANFFVFLLVSLTMLFKKKKLATRQILFAKMIQSEQQEQLPRCFLAKL